MNACPVVCITALAISKLALLIRASASTQTPTQASGPAARQPACGLGDAGEQRVEVRLRVRDAEVDAVGRALAADGADGARLRQRERLAEQRVEGRLAGLGGAFAVDLGAGRFGIRAPVAALGDGLQRAVDGRAVLFEHGVRHGSSCGRRMRRWAKAARTVGEPESGAASGNLARPGRRDGHPQPLMGTGRAPRGDRMPARAVSPCRSGRSRRRPCR